MEYRFTWSNMFKERFLKLQLSYQPLLLQGVYPHDSFQSPYSSPRFRHSANELQYWVPLLISTSSPSSSPSLLKVFTVKKIMIVVQSNYNEKSDGNSNSNKEERETNTRSGNGRNDKNKNNSNSNSNKPENTNEEMERRYQKTRQLLPNSFISPMTIQG